MTLFTVEEREEIAERVSRLLGNDYRIEGVVIVGSLAGQSDRWSDIDIEVIVADDEELSAVTADWVGNLYELLPVVHHFETAFGDTLVRGFLLENLLEVDLAFDQARSLSIWSPAKVISIARDALRMPPTHMPKMILTHRIWRAKQALHGTMYCTPALQCGAAVPGRVFGTWSVSETVP